MVEIGKQLLITPGNLTTFSIANDVSKYFAILPAIFVATYPELQSLNVMRLTSPRSAILSAVIFNALIIVALVPLAMRGVRFAPMAAAQLLRRNLLIYGAGGLVAPLSASSSSMSFSLSWGSPDMSYLRPALVLVAAFTLLLGLAFPLGMVGLGSVAFPTQAGGSLVMRDGRVVGSALIGQDFTAEKYFIRDRRLRPRPIRPTRPSRSRRPITPICPAAPILPPRRRR